MQHAPMPPAAGRMYQLTDQTVSPARQAGRDENGFPREETVCPIKHEKFVDTAGNICDVVLRTGRVADNDPASERYEMLQRRDQILAGCLPLAECPYTQEYRKLTGAETLLGTLPPNVKQCDGHPDGCEHLKPVIDARRAKQRAKHDAETKHLRSMSAQDAEALLTAALNASGLAAPKKAREGAAARGALAAGKGEEE